MASQKKWHRLIDKIPAQAYLWLAILIFGGSGAVTRKLTEIGSQNLIDGRNPISLCNVLFVGNICALMVLMLIYRRQWNKATLRQISRQDWLILTVVAILSGAVAPSLIFQALELTEVNNIILVGRLEPPLILALSFWLLRERVNIWEIVGAIAAFIGVILAIFLQTPGQEMMNIGGFTLGLGEFLTAIASVAVAVSTIISKQRLSRIPIGIYNIFRTALGTVIFFLSAVMLYGIEHFMDIFSPVLWQWMLVYGVVIIVLGQSFWVQGLRNSTVSVASLVGSFTPIAGILAAYFILGETPTWGQYIGGSVILVGIFLSQFGIWQQQHRRVTPDGVKSAPAQQEIEAEIGFKGI
ncbi:MULTISPECIES: DMT family transporter [unclassified Nodularia (in: cyanobacteria)]|uniref:EamA family transporter n=1 Tax=unclassified Nodularia (in: cyanobacteria) TaxID=2656917 RepID=UPI001880F879|nr:DMT family transporter [Nodularia sp. LEGE 06071]MBE9199219.1 EamA family transporter [Nodularia sp. LEGE 06071]MCC2693314.1 EamA family transporter [Nodularia sp. LEGE 04288]